MAGSFPLLTDEHISKKLIKALRDRGREVVRAVDVFGQRTEDEILLECAAQQGRVEPWSTPGAGVVRVDDERGHQVVGQLRLPVRPRWAIVAPQEVRS